MATASNTPSRKATPARKDAIAMLRADHKKVSALFEQFEHSHATASKKDIVAEICSALRVHTQLEEELFYPSAKAALDDDELVPEANVEHATIRSLIDQVENVEPDGEAYDAKVKVMSEYVKHHVKEEQTEMFPKLRKTGLDLVALGKEMATRKEVLLQAAR